MSDGRISGLVYYLFSLVSVESGPRGPSLSVYILHIPVDDTAFGTPRIRSDFRSGSDALLKPSTHSPDRLLTCASSEDFLSLAFFVLSRCARVVRAWTLVVLFLDLAELVEGSVRLPTARPHRFPLAAFSPILSSGFHSPTFSPLAALEPSVSRPDYHLAPFSDRRPTPLRFVAQAHCQHITGSHWQINSSGVSLITHLSGHEE